MHPIPLNSPVRVADPSAPPAPGESSAERISAPERDKPPMPPSPVGLELLEPSTLLRPPTPRIRFGEHVSVVSKKGTSGSVLAYTESDNDMGSMDDDCVDDALLTGRRFKLLLLLARPSFST